MAITSNVDFLNTYDGNFQVVSARILPDIAPHDDEFAAQVCSIETLRTLIASGMSVDDYNNLTEEAWQAIKDSSHERAKLNVNAPVAHLLLTEREAAQNIGGNFFEHSYLTIIGATQQVDKVSFTKIGGV